LAITRGEARRIAANIAKLPPDPLDQDMTVTDLTEALQPQRRLLRY